MMVVDYMPMSKTKIWLIQLLNIAGTGPILALFLVHYMDLLQCFGLLLVVFCWRSTRLFLWYVKYSSRWRNNAIFGG